MIQKTRTSAGTGVGRRVWRCIAAIVIPALTACLLSRSAHVTVTMVTLVLVLEVAGTALRWGRTEAIFAAMAASVLLDHDFLRPPVLWGGGLEEWTVLLLFLATAFGIVFAKRRLCERGIEADRRSHDVKSALLTALAHDARGPLYAIKLAATTLLSGRAGEPTRQRELTGIILDEVERMSRWINETCELSQAEPNHFVLQIEPHDVSESVARAMEGLAARLAGRSVRIHIPGGLPRVDCDPEMVPLILKLLLDNAMKYSPPGSPITISASADEQRLVIHVSDAGPGITENERGRIFEKRYRGAHHASKVEGTGLGLPSAKRMLEMQGGEIWVSNRPEGGAEFSFSLPLAGSVQHAAAKVNG